MTTLVEARATLIDALDAASAPASSVPGRLAPPCVLVIGDGVDVTQIGRGQVLASFRLVLLAGRFDAAAASDALADLTQKVLTGLRTLEGWGVSDISPDYKQELTGGTWYAGSLSVSVMVDV